ncbi:MAG: DUF3106 domain-containing protein [Burkholderiales bacterium]|nr:DUF3106 domain-containing protein [Burkholderiales bacterium]
MRMTRAATTLPPTPPRLLIALLLSAAGLCAFAQTPETPAAPEPAASVAAPVVAAKPQPLAKPAVPTLAAPPAWAGLTPGQQALLAPLANDWNGISATQRSKWLSATPTLATLPAPELARVHDRMREWARLTPIERQNARIGFQVAKQVDAEQRQAKWEAYQALTPEERQALNDKGTARRQAQATPPVRPAKKLEAQPKSNIVPAAPKLLPATAVAGSLIQAKPGATTVLMTRGPALPGHHSAGEAKVVADPALVDPKTLLPKSLKAPSASTPGQ